MSTGDDEKVALLASIFDNSSYAELLQALVDSDGSVTAAIDYILDKPAKRETSAGPQKSLPLLQWSSSAERKDRQVVPALHLYTPETVAARTPCTLILNALPPELAKSLLITMLEESQDWSRNHFKLFDRQVISPHRSAFFVDPSSSESHESYEYNGSRLENTRVFPQKMQQAKPIIDKLVNQTLSERPNSHPFQVKPGQWSANVAFSNLYVGSNENVGYHADQLTYLGPQPVIASLSLGCEREFRIKSVIPGNDSRPIGIHLPSNSLLIMHAGMQEEYKHCIQPATALTRHPVADTSRINITFRYYRPSFHPKRLPRCRCGSQAILRTVQRGRPENIGKYFWACDTDKLANSDHSTGCGFFQFAKFDKNGDLAS